MPNNNERTLGRILQSIDSNTKQLDRIENRLIDFDKRLRHVELKASVFAAVIAAGVSIAGATLKGIA